MHMARWRKTLYGIIHSATYWWWILLLFQCCTNVESIVNWLKFILLFHLKITLFIIKGSTMTNKKYPHWIPYQLLKTLIQEANIICLFDKITLANFNCVVSLILVCGKVFDCSIHSTLELVDYKPNMTCGILVTTSTSNDQVLPASNSIRATNEDGQSNVYNVKLTFTVFEVLQKININSINFFASGVSYFISILAWKWSKLFIWFFGNIWWERWLISQNWDLLQ